MFYVISFYIMSVESDDCVVNIARSQPGPSILLLKSPDI